MDEHRKEQEGTAHGAAAGGRAGTEARPGELKEDPAEDVAAEIQDLVDIEEYARSGKPLPLARISSSSITCRSRPSATPSNASAAARKSRFLAA